jgi:hypothetical protein
VALPIPGKVIWSDINNAPFVYVAGRNQAALDEFSQPRSRAFIELVVIGAHANLSV